MKRGRIKRFSDLFNYKYAGDIPAREWEWKCDANIRRPWLILGFIRGVNFMSVLGIAWWLLS